MLEVTIMRMLVVGFCAALLGATCAAQGFRDQPPDPAESPAVWTGREVLVWSGAGTQSGGRYDPLSNRWTAINVGPRAPSGRMGHTVVWSGTRMIVWGGKSPSGLALTDGAAYDPVSDDWRPLAPFYFEGRYAHTAVFTGQAMIVWGGQWDSASFLGDGGLYDVAADTWRKLPAVALEGRSGHTAVWTGSEMVVWGGGRGGPRRYGDGARYDPVADRWRATASPGAPQARRDHTAVWTGSEMIVWGGLDASNLDLATGGRYDPVTDTWTPTSVGANVPIARDRHSAVWTGSEMLVWGRRSTPGGRYDPATDSWRSIDLSPEVFANRVGHAAVFTGSEMIVYGGLALSGQLGLLNSGGRYDVASGMWRAMPLVSPSGRWVAAVWSGTELIVWGGYSGRALGDGGRYDPATDRWRPVAAAGAPAPRSDHAMVWTGSRVVVWGGSGATGPLGDGASYDPVADSWAATSALGAPSARATSGVWTGSEMIVWGGVADQSGGRYDAASDSWRPTSTTGAVASPRYGHVALWTGTEMIVWSGAEIPTGIPVNTGARYDPISDSWSGMATAGAPPGTVAASAAWTGSQMVAASGRLARYEPATDRWLPMAQPAASAWAKVMAWDGREVLLWGGDIIQCVAAGGRYDPIADRWQPMSTRGQPTPRTWASSAWTGRDLVVWGGAGSGQVVQGISSAYLSSGGVYDPRADRWSVARPVPASVLVAKGPGPAYDAAARAYRVDGTAMPLSLDAFPGIAPQGANLAAGDVVAGGDDEILAAPGPDAATAPRVRGFVAASATPIAGLDFLPYGAGGFGARVATGRPDASMAMLTGPGPSSAYGPHVRAFRYGYGGVVSPVAGISFFAYGTLRYGVHVAAADTDSDGYDEILAGAGPGVMFGPHVRGFNHDGAALAPIAGINFFAYGTLRYGVEVGGGDVDGDGAGEILTGPGPGAPFTAVLRGFDVDGRPAVPIGRINAVVFTGARLGVNVAVGDLDADGYGEIAAGAGPDPAYGSRLAGLDYDGATLAPIGPLALDPFGLSHGTRVAAGALGP